MEDTSICFFDLDTEGITVVLFHQVVSREEQLKIRKAIKKQIEEDMQEDNEYTDTDFCHKISLKKALNKLNYKYEIIASTDYVISF